MAKLDQKTKLSTPIRVAGVGAGYFSRFHYDGWLRNSDVQLVGIADRDPEKAKAMAQRDGDVPVFETLDAMIGAASPDLIDIIAPPTVHLELIDQATRAGLPVICQKPFCTSIDEAKAAIKLAEERGVLLVVHENFRFQPWYRKLAELIRDGALGDIYQITFRLRPGDGQGPRRLSGPAALLPDDGALPDPRNGGALDRHVPVPAW